MEKRGPNKVNPHTKRQQRLAKSKCLKTRVTNPMKVNWIQLGDPMVNTKNSTNKVKATKPKDTIGIDDIGIFEFMFEGLPNPPNLEGIDEDRLFELYKSNCTKEMKKEKEILQKEYKSLRKHLIL